MKHIVIKSASGFWFVGYYDDKKKWHHNSAWRTEQEAKACAARLNTIAEVPPADPDICRNNHNGNARSEEANSTVHPHKESLRHRILEFIETRQKENQPTGLPQITSQLRMLHQTASARLSELKRDGIIKAVAIGQTTSGCKCDLYFLVDQG